MSFLGRTSYLMDNKNRVPMPPKYRPAFELPARLTRGQDRCVAVYTQESFSEAKERIGRAVDQESAMGRQRRRDFFGYGDDVARDAQGRLAIPADLVEYARLKRNVVVVGVEDYFEIWDAETLAQHAAALGSGE